MENRQRKKSVFDRFILWLLAILQRSFIGRFFTSYDRANDRFERIVKETRHTNGKGFASFVERNRLIGCVPKIVQFMMRVPLRDYGIMMFMSGAVVTALYPINDMILFINVTFDMFVLGAAICVASIPLLFSSRSLAENVLSSKIFCALLFDFLGMDKEGFRVAAEKEKVSFATFSFLIGASLGVASYFILPTNTLLIALALVLAYSTIRTPEVGAVVTILLIPFINVGITCICVAYTFACYMIKVSLGKRIFKFEYFDLWISITILVITLTGFNYKNPLSSLMDVAVNLVIMLSYFLFANLIYSKEYFRRGAVALTTSSLIVSIIAVIQAIMCKVAESVTVLQNIFPLDGEIVATFGTSRILAHFMVISIPFALVHMISEKSDANKFGGFLMSALFIAALILSKSPVGLLGLLVGALLIFVFYKKHALYLLLTVAVALPVLYFTLPDAAINAIFSWGPLSGVSIPGEFAYIKDSFLKIIEYPFGINIVGASMVEAFGEDYIDSLPLQLLAKYGIVGVLSFLVLAVMFIRVTMSYAIKAKNEYRRVNGCAGLCSVLALLSVGIFSNIWIDKKIFLLFVTIVALSFAYIKIEREEELVSTGNVDITAASVDIPLREAVKQKLPTRTSYVHVPKPSKKSKKQEKTAEAKEFTNTQELFVVKRKLAEYEMDEEE